MGTSGVVGRVGGAVKFYRAFTRMLAFLATVGPVMRSIRTVGAPCFRRKRGGGRYEDVIHQNQKIIQ